ncbi:MAG: LysM peptidoglycan-binding domain-containing protein [Haliscomenobacter sp.]|nr:LysM peptidoglycan-binding domain-containing protein [Haliscomenobacter sp.]
MKNLLVLSNLLILFFLGNSLFAASYFLYYDPNCVDRLEYVYPETKAGSEFIIYSVFISETEKLLLEIGLENQSPVQPSLPAAMINCNSQDRSILGPALMDAINNKIHQFYIVSPIGNGQYRVAQVRQANYYKNTGVAVSATSAQYRFDFFRDGRSTTGDLSANDARGRVFYMEIAGYGPCSTYVFRQTYITANNYLDIYVVPEFGIVEERSGSVNSSFKLKRVNGTEAENYLRRVCELGMARIMEGTMTSRSPASYDQMQMPANKTYAPRIHVVEKGESQFSISRRYQLYVSDLQAWNNLDNNTTLYPGMKLFIEPPAKADSYDFPATAQSRSPNKPAASGAVPAWVGAQETVTVQTGETAGSLARKYGYTEERFRYFNNLSPTTVLRPGDVVKTSDCEPSEDRGALDSYETVNPPTTPTSKYYQDPYWTETASAANELTPRSYSESPSPAPATTASSQLYYGPVPGAYNSNQPLYEPVTDPNAYLKNNPALTAPAPYEYTAKTAVPSAGPDSYNVNMVPKSPNTWETKSAARRIHIVKDGETLTSISRRYGITLETVRKLNNLSAGETIIPFQRLYIN